MKSIFLKKLKDEKGQSLVEFALILILLLLLLLGIVEFARAWFKADLLKGAANIAARTYAIDKDSGKAETAAEGIVDRDLTLNTNFFVDTTTTPGQVTVTVTENFQSVVYGILPMLTITISRDATYRLEN